VSYTYDAFISYVRRDEAWAKRVAEDLGGRGFETFLDTDTLVGGAEWESQLVAGVEASQHMVVLWSEGAASEWVTKEVSTFQATIRHTATSGEGSRPRLVIPVYLSGEDSKILAKYQHIDVIRAAGAYDAGPAAVPVETWRAVIDRLDTSIRHADAARRVPLLVVTTTHEALSNVDPTRPLPPPPMAGRSLEALIEQLGIPTREQLLQSYGNNRGDWRPFGSELGVREILEQLKDEINLELSKEGLQRFRWDSLDDEFWSEDPEAVAERLKREPTVVVLDPVALYDHGVSWMTTNYLLPNVRQNDNAVVVVLPPFAMPSSAAALRESIRGLATEVFNSYYNPPVFSETRYARYVTSVGDVVDLKAWLLTGIGPVLAAKVGGNGNVYTDQ
jgi:hypothetical protein